MDFLKSKVRMAQQDGITLKADSINPRLKPHQAAMVDWLVSGGRRACFASFGLGKSVVQLEALRIILESEGGRALIVCPLGVRQEFVRDAKNILGWTVLPKFIRRIEEAEETGIYITNYETVRDGKLDPAEFIAVTLDEAAILRGFGGSKTFREFMLLCTGDGGPTGRSRGDGKVVKYRFVATATPSPNEYIELLAYADFLGVMDVSQAKTRFFKRDSTKADKLTLHSHKEEEFWLWVASWALFVQKPSDLGFSDEGYALPDLEIKWHQVASDYTDAGYETNGQKKLLRDAAIGVQDAAAEKRSSMGIRIGKVLDLLKSHHASESGDLVSAAGWQSIVWCDLNPEQDLLESRLKAAGISASSIRGSDELDGREATLNQWLARETSVFLSKPSMYGAGVNLQQCHHMVFAGIGFKFADVIQAVHRIHRFLQREKCNVEFIFTEAEYAVKKTLERKWKQHTIMINKMTEIIQKFGLSQAAMAQHLTRKMGVDEPLAVEGERFRLVNDDTVKQTAKLEEDSIDLVVTSIPFSTQYEYSPNYADFGHSEGNDEFFGQMDYLTPELFRALKPGRLACIHVKDRIVPGGMTGLGFQTVYPFHARTMDHFMKHGFAYMGMKTIVTDVVRENNQTYRLGWTEQCKDGSKMGVGMPEYLLIFRKPPTDTANSYADEPVVKSKREYSRSRWQIDAHGFTRSSGDRPLTCEDLKGATHADIFQLFKQHSLETVYNFEHHVKFGEEIDKMKMLPVTFMLLQPQSWSDEVWTDVTRMRTLNGSQWSKGKEMHLCPMQFDIADRCIEQFSQKGEIVFDPFSGLGTVPQRAVLKGRRGLGFELNPGYFLDSVSYLQAAEAEVSTPSLFDLVEIEAANIARR
jgi:DNA modification methylase